ncbi:MAG: preprotein translocase subunit SecY, partial [Clostridiales bacterium]|nr:preprotein translocase subunit SecY [Clostridiales bacterium]
ITLALLFIYRLGCWIPIPGLSPEVFRVDNDSLLSLMSAITGNALQNGALFAIGITPYINASIILQLLTVAIPKLQEYQKQGDSGKRKITQITRYITIALALAQSIGITVSYARAGALSTDVFGPLTSEWVIGIFVCVIMISGAMLTMWLGERITDYGIGNGISLLIFVGIISSAGIAIRDNIYAAATGASETAVWELLGFVIMVVAVFMLIVFVDLAERRVPVQYAKQIKGRKQYGGQSTYIPIKVNASGVLPIIFATAIITFPQMIAQLFTDSSNAFYIWWQEWLGAGKPIYIVLVALLILFFSYFYAQIEFNPEEISRNIQQYGGFINGIRPGKPTTEYLSRISKRLTLFGAIFLAFIALVPSVIFSVVLGNQSLVNAFSATGMLIVVSVALEFNKQLQSQLMMKQYKGFLK